MSGLLEVSMMLLHVMIVVAILFLMPIPFTWIERKVAGHMQQRMGPMRVGWHGMLQPIADVVKLIAKEDTIPDQADHLLFKIAPIIALVPPFAVFVAIPFADSLYLSDMNVGLLYILAVGGLEIYGVIFGGWAANSKYALLGSMRTCAQLISYEIPMGFAIIGVMMLSQSMNCLLYTSPSPRD